MSYQKKVHKTHLESVLYSFRVHVLNFQLFIFIFQAFFFLNASEVSEAHPFTHQTGGNFPKTQPGAAFWDSWPVAKRAFCCRYESKGTLDLGGILLLFFWLGKARETWDPKKKVFRWDFFGSVFCAFKTFLFVWRSKAESLFFFKDSTDDC